MNNFSLARCRYKEFREFCEDVPCVLVANKIDVDYNVTRKEFKFAAKHNLPFFFVSAADGTNVVKVFQSAILEAKRFKESGGDLLSNLLETLEGAEVTKYCSLNSFITFSFDYLTFWPIICPFRHLP